MFVSAAMYVCSNNAYCQNIDVSALYTAIIVRKSMRIELTVRDELVRQGVVVVSEKYEKMEVTAAI